MDVEIGGAGRTDAGVHAIAQVAHLKERSRSSKRPEEIRRALNTALPADVVILSVEPAQPRFHARHDAIGRSYLYQISIRKTAFNKKYVWWIKERLDLAAMAYASAQLVGRHNFDCFRALDPTKLDTSPIVVVDAARLEAEGDMILFRIEASHFLWRMVRRIVGVLVKIGKGELKKEQFDLLLQGRCHPSLDVAAWTAPASGLFLEQVRYKD
ncbi:MAG: tRNA pseudouridine synthase A [Bryobacteraceae bacterium]